MTPMDALTPSDSRDGWDDLPDIQTRHAPLPPHVQGRANPGAGANLRRQRAV